MFSHAQSLKPLLRPKQYSDSEWFRLERERVSAKAWSFGCLVSDIPSKNDCLVRTLSSGSSVILWNVDGEPRAYLNICRHRCSKVRPDGSGTVDTLRCGYHGWEYGKNGRPCKIPDATSFKGADFENLALKRLRTEKIGGLIFVCAESDASSLRELLGEQHDEIENFFGNTKTIWRLEQTLPVNWKVVLENAVESYHVPLVHPGTFSDYRPSEQHEHVLGSAYTLYRDLKPWDGRWRDRLVGKLSDWTLPKSTLKRFSHLHFFPYTVFYYSDVYRTLIDVVPEGPESTRVIYSNFAPARLRNPWISRPLQAVFLSQASRFFRRVAGEDTAALIAAHQGLKSAPFAAGPLGIREERVHAFQKFVVDSVGAEWKR